MKKPVVSARPERSRRAVELLHTFTFITLLLLSFSPALHAKAGKVLWSVKTGSYINSSPCVWDNKVYFGSGDNKLYCADASSGKTLWTIQTGNYVDSSPCVWDGKVYFGSCDYKLYCVDNGSKEKGAAYSSISGME
jgi:outer membrane protein assembly factor BamB